MQQRLTAEEFATVPSDRAELVDGRVVSMSPTTLGHGLATKRFTRFLDRYAEETGNGEVVTGEVGFVTQRSPDRVRAPDVAYVVRERIEGRDPGTFFEGAPDLAVEVLSPSERARDAEAKVAEYLTAGTRLVWVADIESQRIFVHRPGQPNVILGLDDDLDGGDVLPGFRVAVAKLLGR